MSSFPGAYNFDRVKKPTWSDSINDSIGGVAVNLTGYTPTLRMRLATGDVAYSTAAGVTVNATGDVSWSLDISAWATGPLDYDLAVVSPGGVTSWLLAGTVTVTP